MKQVFRQTELYRFLNYCNNVELEGTVLDCGAGGNCPPLALFSYHGYKTYGIEINKTKIEMADDFSKKYGMSLNIMEGDIRTLPFEDESISFIYSYNTIFHMTKEEVKKTMDEIKRVLKPGGLCFVNFPSKHDSAYGDGEKVGEGEFLQDEGDEKIIHSYYGDDEAEAYFEDMDIVFKENRILQRIYEGEKITQGYIDYIAEKKLK